MNFTAKPQHQNYSLGRFLFVILCIAISLPVSAALPTTITYQGSLKQNGTPVNGQVTISVNVVDANGTPCWTGPALQIMVKEGLYHYDLTPTTCDLNSSQLYVQTLINSNKLTPPEPLNSVPYALMAKDLAAGATAKGNVLVQGKLGVGGGPLFWNLELGGGEKMGWTTNSSSFLEDNYGPGFVLGMTSSQYGFRVFGLTDANKILEVNANGQTLLSNGTAAAPALSFMSDPGTGLFRYSAGNMFVSLSGVSAYAFTPTQFSPGLNGLQALGSPSAKWANTWATRVNVDDGSAASPAFCFSSEGNSGLYRYSAGNISMTLSGTQAYNFTPTQFSPSGNGTQGLGSPSAKWSAVWAANGTIQNSSSFLKRDIREIHIANGSSQLLPITPNPKPTAASIASNSKTTASVLTVPRGIVFKWKDQAGKPTDQDLIGFMGDDLPLEAHAIKPDGTRDPESFYTSAVIGIMAAKIKDLEQRLAVLESQKATTSAASGAK